jgi:L-aspartate oxidase
VKILIVGSGIAGLIAALQLSVKHTVTLCTKGRLAESNTRYAQGGIAAVMTADDSIAEHVEDTLRAGAGLCNRAAVQVLCAEGPERIKDLLRIGVEFDRRNGELARGLEAAHSHARVLHAGGDATGLAIEMALVAAVRAARVDVRENCLACDLIVESGRVVGLQVLDENRQQRTMAADAVILASGGAGQLYPHTTNPSVATGDGVAMALRAGAELADVEFYQFHPTALAIPGNFLVSEAVRGDGAVLRALDGHRFMLDIDPAGELAPRDVVARGIAAQMARQGGRPVLLDATQLGAGFLAKRFPTIDAACRRFGLNWAHEPVPVTPAAHYWMGGIRTDLWGRSSLPGLFAVGEVACTGVHGANRLASNSLLESLVFAWRTSQLLLEWNTFDSIVWPALEEPHQGSRNLLEVPLEPLERPSEISRSELQQTMWEGAGIYRDGDGLRAALTRLNGSQVSGNSLHARETRNLLEVGRAVVIAALARAESRGAHFRLDYPVTREEFAHQTIERRTAEAVAELV